MSARSQGDTVRRAAPERVVEYDVLVIGAGLAGLVAAAAASEAGARVGVVSQSTGNLALWSGMLGRRPPRGRDETAAARFFVDVAAKAGLAYRVLRQGEAQAVGPDGRAVAAGLVPETVAKGMAAARGRGVLVVGLGGLDEYPSALIAGNLTQELGQLVRHRTVALGPASGRGLAPRVARLFDDAGWFKRFLDSAGRVLAAEATRVGAVAFPPVLGFQRFAENLASLEEVLGCPVFELGAWPPSVPGERFGRLWRHRLEASGRVEFHVGRRVTEATVRGETCVEASDGETRYRARAFVLATGGVAGGGLVVPCRGVLRLDGDGAELLRPAEPVFDLPTRGEEGDWARWGVATDRAGRPYLEPGGRRVLSNVFAAGWVLGGRGPDEPDGLLSLVSGWRAGSLAARSALEVSGRGEPVGEVEARPRTGHAPAELPTELPTELRAETSGACIGCEACVVACPVAAAHGTFGGPKALGPGLDRRRSGGWPGDPGLGPEEATSLGASLCLQCHRCELACPLGLDVSRRTPEAKALARARAGPREVPARLTLDQERLGRLAGAARTPRRAVRAVAPGLGRRLEQLGLGLIGLDPRRTLPAPAPLDLLRWLARTRCPETERGRPVVVLFAGCHARFLDPSPAVATALVLRAAGFRVVLPRQVCCGSPALSAGEERLAAESARANAALLGHELGRLGEETAVVSPCPSCVLSLRRRLPELVGTPEAARVAAAVWDLGEFLAGPGRAGLLRAVETTTAIPHTAAWTYHTPCHLRALGVGRPFAGLLRDLGAGTWVDAGPSADLCCGMGGLYGLTRAGYGRSLETGRPALDAYRELRRGFATGPEGGRPAEPVALSDCPACRWQIAEAAGLATTHPVELVAHRLGLSLTR